MTDDTNQMAEFIEYLRDRNSPSVGQGASETQAEILAFIEMLESSEQGRAEREADPVYQIELAALVECLPIR
jgi:hypothetical protein